MLYSRIFYHGTLAGVTDSCHGLWAKAEASFLIDCDLFQRADSSGSVSRLEYLLDTVRALIAAHIYIRYLGQISSSLAAAFRELCSKAAAALLPIVTRYTPSNMACSNRYRNVQAAFAHPSRSWRTKNMPDAFMMLMALDAEPHLT